MNLYQQQQQQSEQKVSTSDYLANKARSIVAEQKNLSAQINGATGLDLTPSEYSMISKAMSVSEDPEATANKFAQALTYSHNSGITFEDAYNNLDALNYAQLGKKVDVTQTGTKAVINSFKIGNLTVKRQNAAKKAYMAYKDGEDVQSIINSDIGKEIQAIDDEIASLQDYTPRAWYTEIFKNTANTLSYSFNVAAAAGVGKAIGAVAGSTPVGTGLATLFSFAQGYALTKYGNWYDNVKNGVDPDVADKVQTISAGVQAAIESVLDVNVGLVRGLGTGTAKTIASKTLKNMYVNGTLNKITLYLTKYGLNMASEGTEEFLQEITDEVGENVAYALSGMDAPNELGDILTNSVKAYIGGASSAIILGIGDAVYETKMDVEYAQNLKKEAIQTPSKETFINRHIDDEKLGETLSRSEKSEILSEAYDKTRNAAKDEGVKLTETSIIDTDYDINDDFENNPDAPGTEDAKVSEQPVEPIKRMDNGRVRTQESTRVTQNTDGTESHTLNIGSRGSSTRYGYVDYTLNTQTKTVTIDEVKTKQGYEEITRDAILEVERQYEGWNIEWNPSAESQIKIKDQLINDTNNPNRGNLQWFKEGQDTDTSIYVGNWIKKTFTNLTDEQSIVAANLLQFTAQAQGTDVKTWINDHIQNLDTFDEAGKKGAVKFDSSDIKAIIYAGKNADFSTFSHETFHVLIRTSQAASQLSSALKNASQTAEFAKYVNSHKQIIKMDLDEVIDAVKDMGDDPLKWTRSQHEVAATFFEAYLRDGQTFNEKLKNIFTRIADWFHRIYRAILGENSLNEEIIKAYDEILAGNPELKKTVETSQEVESTTQTVEPTLQDESKYEASEYDEDDDNGLDEFGNPLYQTDDEYKETEAILRADSKNFDADGNHLAPNGQKSNLTYKQWVQVRTDSFKKWFGDWEKDPQNASKVLDENGEPKVVIHGTYKDFDVYDSSKIERTSEGFGFYFIDNEVLAAQYGDKFVKAYLNLRNPVYAWTRMENNTNERVDQMLSNLKDKGYVFYDEVSTFTDAIKKNKSQTNGGVLDEYLDLDGYIESYNGSEEIDERQLYRDIRQAEIEVYGIDGYKTKNYKLENASAYVAFLPNQIKSSVNNSGDFSLDNDSILFQLNSNKQQDYQQSRQKILDNYADSSLYTKVGTSNVYVYKNYYEEYLSGKLNKDFTAKIEKNLKAAQTLENEGFQVFILPEQIIISGKNFSGKIPDAIINGYLGEFKELTSTKYSQFKKRLKNGLEKADIVYMSLSDNETVDNDGTIRDILTSIKGQTAGKDKYDDKIIITSLEGKNLIAYKIKKGTPNEVPLTSPDVTTSATNNIASKEDIVNNLSSNNTLFQQEEYDPRATIPKVRGSWTKEKILRYLKNNKSLSGQETATRIIAEFDSPEQLKEHMFYHGTVYGSGALKPSITMSDRELSRVGGGGYGERYWAISLTTDKKVASNFSGISHNVSIYPVILVKNAKVVSMDLSDSIDLDEHIVALYAQGVDAVWIGGGEKELCVINPRAIVNLDKSDDYRVFGLGTEKNPIMVKTDEQIKEMWEFARNYRQNPHTERDFNKPSRFYENFQKKKTDEQYQAELNNWHDSEDYKNYQDLKSSMRKTIFYQLDDETESSLVEEARNFEDRDEFISFEQAFDMEEMSVEELGELWDKAHGIYRTKDEEKEYISPVDKDMTDDQKDEVFRVLMSTDEGITAFIQRMREAFYTRRDIRRDKGNVGASSKEEYDQFIQDVANADRIEREAAPYITALAVSTKDISPEAIVKVRGMINNSLRDYRDLYSQVIGDQNLAAGMYNEYMPDIKDSRANGMRITERKELVKRLEGEEIREAVRRGTEKYDGTAEKVMAVYDKELSDLKEKYDKLNETYKRDYLALTREESSNASKQIKIKKMESAIKRERQIIRQKLDEDRKVPTERLQKLKGWEDELALLHEEVKELRNQDKVKATLEKHEALQKLRTQIKEKQKAKAEAEAVHRYKRDLYNSITEKISNNVDYSYVQKIREVIATIKGIQGYQNETIMVDGKRMALSDFRKAVEDGTIKVEGLTDYQLKRYLNTSLADLTISDLETLKDTVDYYKQMGKQMWQAKVDQRAYEAQNLRSQIIGELYKSKNYNPDNDKLVGTLESDKQRKKGKLKEFYHKTLNWNRKAQILDNDTKGINYDLTVEERRVHQDEQLTGVRNRVNPIKKAFEDAGIKEQDFYNTVTVLFPDGKSATLSVGKLAYAMLADKNERNYNAVAYGNLVSSEEKQNMTGSDNAVNNQVKSLGNARYQALKAQAEEYFAAHPEYMKVIDAIIADWNSEENLSRIQKVLIEEYNQPMEVEGFYMTMHRQDFNGEESAARLRDDMYNLNAGKGTTTPEKGFTKSRIDLSPLHQQPVDMDIYKLWLQSVEDQENVIANLSYVRKLNRIYKGYGSTGLKSIIENTHGKAILTDLENYINEIANSNIFQDTQEINGIVSKLRGGLYTGYLGYKLSSIVLQGITSPLPSLQEVTPVQLAKGLMQMTMHPVSSWKTICELSPYMEHRSIDPAIDAIKKYAAQYTDSKMQSAYRKFLEFGTSGLEAIDRWAVSGSWIAVYEKKLAELGDSKAAAHYADNFVRDTQPSGDITEIAPLFKSRIAFAQAFTQFQVSLNVIWNNTTYDLPKAAKKHEFKKAVGIVFGYALAGALVNLVQGGYDEDDEPEDIAKKLAYSLTTQFTQSTPLLGSFADGVAQTFITGDASYYSMNQLYPGISSIYTGIKQVFAEDKYGNRKGLTPSAIKNIASGISNLVGLPTSGAKELWLTFFDKGFVEAIEDGDLNFRFNPGALLGQRDN